MLEPEDFKADWQRETYDKAVNSMNELLNLANAIGSRKFVVQGMLTALIREHRTLQQAGIRSFVGMLTEWAKLEEARMVDARNKAAWDFAQKVKELDPLFPTI